MKNHKKIILIKDLLTSITKKIENQNNKHFFSRVIKDIVENKKIVPLPFPSHYNTKRSEESSLNLYSSLHCLDQKIPDSVLLFDISDNNDHLVTTTLVPRVNVTLISNCFILCYNTEWTLSAPTIPRKGNSAILEVPKEIGFIQPKDVGEEILSRDHVGYDTINLKITLKPKLFAVDSELKKYRIQLKQKDIW